MPAPGLGLGTRVQAVPSQCSIRVCPWLSAPTAQTSLADTARTLVSWLPLGPDPRSGPGTTVQDEPSQCSMSGWSLVLSEASLVNQPTAQMSVGEMAPTPVRWLPALPGSGLGSTVQDEPPAQCSMSVWAPPGSLAAVPTAQTLHADTTATPASSLT